MNFNRKIKQVSLGMALTLSVTTLIPITSLAETSLKKQESINELKTSVNNEMVETTSISGHEDVKSKVIEDNNEKKVVEAWDNEGKYRATSYKNRNEVVTETLDRNGVVLSKTSTSQTQVTPLKDNIQYNPPAIELVDSGQDWLERYKYYFYTENVWVIQIPGRTKNPIQSANNKADLGAFRTAVNNLRVEQIGLTKAMGGVAVDAAVAVATVPTVLDGLLY
ncbi:geobacillin-26 family protein [Bacillus thuringiensis]|uniref:geobacillin-26 family protein n=1 Tax=Bacillus thuringiensis TaxID=1428 RepID=UPI00211D94B6|nr:geobacillin-26 family protein [Bacillus thuringiensis]